ncbi:succinate dehydrogenase, hydrophobic membrane anchor protein [Kumtagia ephedrae]|jgi:succinate dehydrogenase / fumarate reductase membrane anchor subunit|uniref:Succinate dehydrogenase hydrophobic membrane anchor subunit n=1 Tax=Kumtagia ephedrae TaxID=2116701 RepID=A0A2P7RQX6_9HYPH|nr:succinate dehydrogenase, hydrophobic membrane anchor protein [Mesorhizobium ephedrae]PSJ52609.1 succinate dehydrogenase, hydrophobic membrane anchor protein [Mesorhizobium ephedrae]
MADMRTPLNRVRGLGSAKEGTGHFWRIRLSAIALVPLALFMVGWVLSLRGAGYAEVRASLSQPLVALAAAAFIVASLDHMRLGMQIIIEDYVHGEGSKLALLILNTFFSFAVGIASLFALLKLAFGG